MPLAQDAALCDGGELMSIPLHPGTATAWVTAYKVNDYFWNIWQAGIDYSRKFGQLVIESTESGPLALIPGKGEEPLTFDASNAELR